MADPARRDQELAVGRDKLTGCPLVAIDADRLVTDPGCPVAGSEIWRYFVAPVVAGEPFPGASALG